MNKLPIRMIRYYQKHISPYKRGACCKFIPSCSQYALIAYGRFGFFKATWLTISRLFRCNPFSKGGFDPVPDVRPKNN